MTSCSRLSQRSKSSSVVADSALLQHSCMRSKSAELALPITMSMMAGSSAKRALINSAGLAERAVAPSGVAASASEMLALT
jgi:hypothetical protein